MITSWRPRLARVRYNVPERGAPFWSGARAAYLLGTTRVVHPGGASCGFSQITEGSIASCPGQKGHPSTGGASEGGDEADFASVRLGRSLREGAKATHRLVMRSWRVSGVYEGAITKQLKDENSGSRTGQGQIGQTGHTNALTGPSLPHLDRGTATPRSGPVSPAARGRGSNSPSASAETAPASDFHERSGWKSLGEGRESVCPTPPHAKD